MGLIQTTAAITYYEKEGKLYRVERLPSGKIKEVCLGETKNASRLVGGCF